MGRLSRTLRQRQPVGMLTPTQRAIALIRSQFSAGQAGLWCEAGTFTGLYQNSAGTTPATAVAQPAGLMLDKRLGLARGPEMLTNTGGPFTATTGWTTTGTQSVVGGQIEVVSTAASGQATSQTLTSFVVGKRYEISATFSSAAGNTTAKSARLSVVRPSVDYPAQYEVSANGTPRTITFSFIATATTLVISLEIASLGAWGSVGDKAYLSNVSCKVLDGNHASQATAGARPTIGAAGGIQYLAFDGTDDALNTGAITLAADMDCFMAIHRDSAAAFMFASTAGALIGVTASGDGGAASTAVGTPTYAVNNVDVAGGTATTRAQLHTAIPTGQWLIVEARNLNLSAWVKLYLLNWSTGAGFTLNGGVNSVILLPAQSDANRAMIRKYLGSKVGLTL